MMELCETPGCENLAWSKGLCGACLKTRNGKNLAYRQPAPAKGRGIFATTVLLHGTAFPRSDKEPFQRSGFSLWGALELLPKTDEVRCHECGEWHRGLFQHVRDHDLLPRDYRIRHGLAQSTALCGLAYATEISRRIKKQGVPNRLQKGAKRLGKKAAKSPQQHHGPSPETLNVRRSCSAQLLARVAELTVKLQRVPKRRELDAAGISTSSLREAFGSVATAVRNVQELQQEGP